MSLTSSAKWESSQASGVFALHDATIKAMLSSVASLRLALEKVVAVQEASRGRTGEEMAEAVESCIKILNKAASGSRPSEDLMDLHDASIRAVEEALPVLKRTLAMAFVLRAAASGFQSSKAYTLVPRLRIPGLIKVIGSAINQISSNAKMAKVISSVGRQAIAEILSEPFDEVSDSGHHVSAHPSRM